MDGGAELSEAFSGILRTSLEAKGTHWGLCAQLLAASAGDAGLLRAEHVHEGARALLAELDDMCIDVPKAPGQVGRLPGRAGLPRRDATRRDGCAFLRACLLTCSSVHAAFGCVLGLAAYFS